MWAQADRPAGKQLPGISSPGGSQRRSSSNLQSSDSILFERKRQKNTVTFPLLFQVGRTVVIPLAHT